MPKPMESAVTAVPGTSGAVPDRSEIWGGESPFFASVTTVSSVYIGRQPVFDVAGALHGYELLFRPDAEASASGLSLEDGDAATTDTILRAFSDFETQTLLDRKPGMINVTRAFLVGALPLPFGPEQAVLEILETVEFDAEVIAGVKVLAEAGYRLALDDFVWTPAAPEVLPFVDIIKIDVTAMDWSAVETIIERCRPFGVRYLAERVETAEMLQKCIDAGFELFQGYHLGRPQTMTAESLSPHQAGTLQLIGMLADPDTTPDEVEAALRRDPSLTLRLLKIVNSAGFGLNRSISSIRDAVVLVGMGTLRAWMMLLSMAGTVGQEHTLVDALTLARTCESLARMSRLPSDIAFTAGLLRGIAESLGMTGEDLLRGLPALSEELAAPLAGRPSPLTRVLDAVQCYLGRDIAGLIETGVPSSDVAQAYLAAMSWSHTVMSASRSI